MVTYSMSTKSKYRTSNWKEYNKALVNRGAITLWIDNDILNYWYEKNGVNAKRGRKQLFSNFAIETAINIKNVLKLPLRALEGCLNSIFKMMELNIKSPDYSTISKRALTCSLKLKTYNQANAINHIAIDSTGIKVFGEGEWKTRIHGKNKRRKWIKVHLGVNIEDNQIVTSEVTNSNIHDSKVINGLLMQINNKINNVYADGAYDTRSCYEAIEDIGARAIIPPQKNATFWEENHSRNIAVNFQKNNDNSNSKWKKESGYHKRSLAETAMYRYKTIISAKANFRNFASQKNEIISGINVLNKMSTLGMPKSYKVA